MRTEVPRAWLSVDGRNRGHPLVATYLYLDNAWLNIDYEAPSEEYPAPLPAATWTHVFLGGFVLRLNKPVSTAPGDHITVGYEARISRGRAGP